jgi:hypothetical protein
MSFHQIEFLESHAGWSEGERHRNMKIFRLTVEEGENVLHPLFFIYDLFNDAFSSSDYIASNGKMINEWWIGKNTEGIGPGQCQSTIKAEMSYTFCDEQKMWNFESKGMNCLTLNESFICTFYNSLHEVKIIHSYLKNSMSQKIIYKSWKKQYLQIPVIRKLSFFELKKKMPPFSWEKLPFETFQWKAAVWPNHRSLCGSDIVLFRVKRLNIITLWTWTSALASYNAFIRTYNSLGVEDSPIARFRLMFNFCCRGLPPSCIEVIPRLDLLYFSRHLQSEWGWRKMWLHI